MNKPTTFKASGNLLGILLLISLLASVTLTSLDAFADLFTMMKTQWYSFGESFSMIQPHRTVFPK